MTTMVIDATAQMTPVLWGAVMLLVVSGISIIAPAIREELLKNRVTVNLRRSRVPSLRLADRAAGA